MARREPGSASIGHVSDSTDSDTRKGLELFLLSFLALFLELMVIRWAPSVVRMVAYYANLMLISSFLGLGVGAMIGRTRRSVFGWIPALLAIDVGVLLLAQYLTLPGSAAEHRFYSATPRLVNYMSLVGIFLANAGVFVPLGQRIGSLFEAFPPLRAYSWDLGGSLAGTLCFGLFSLTHFSPLLGMMFVCVLLAFLLPRRRWWLSMSVLGLVLICVFRSYDPNAIWSPYYYITVRETGHNFRYVNERSPALSTPREHLRTMMDPPTYNVSVNHDFYQPHGTVNLERYSAGHQEEMRLGRVAYDLPYQIALAHSRVLVLGAGGGTDTEVAVLNGAEKVDAVEIDPVLVKLSGKFNASAIYEDPKVHVYVDDARAFLKRTPDRYDMVIFGWLDSQALFSSMSNLRLDGYIYTVESMRMAYGLLKPDGMLSLSFMAGSSWMTQKLIHMVKTATGQTPLVYTSRGQVIICAPRGGVAQMPSQYGRFVRLDIPAWIDLTTVDAPTDDWPFLYLSARKIPFDYLAVIGLLLIICLPAVFVVRGRSFSVNDGHFLFLGLGFLLLETKSIGDCSLYFGATWVVTMIVVAGVLLMVLAANLLAMRLRRPYTWMYLPLLASLLLLYFVDRDSILALDFNVRLLWSLLVMPLPIFFAGLIFSTTFREGRAPAALLGANLIGAMIGGFCEYLGMVTGTRSLLLLVMGAYFLSFVCRLNLPGAVANEARIPRLSRWV